MTGRQHPSPGRSLGVAIFLGGLQVTALMKIKFPTLEEQGSRSPRAEAIVADAIRLITEEGYGEFSLRKVAARNGIKLASLQYHFKTREALLDAVLEQVLLDLLQFL